MELQFYVEYAETRRLDFIMVFIHVKDARYVAFSFMFIFIKLLYKMES